MSSYDAAAAYDAFPYPDLAFWFTHPDQLHTMARLSGMRPAAPETCRVLELGCAVGGNVIPMALSLPAARIVGVDISPKQIAAARERAAALGADNLELLCADIRALPEDLGEFDYIICHGLLSWVPEDVRGAILELCRERLSPQGVAYVSYNTYPGCKVVEIVRDWMRLHTEPFDDDALRIEQGVAIVDWLGERANRHEDDWRAGFLLHERAGLRQMPQATVLHDYLADINQPYYFRDFVRLAAAHDLQYLSDAKPWDMWLDNFDADVSSTLGPVPGIVRQAQYLDFVTHRRFRMTLLCHGDVELDRKISGTASEGFHVHAAFADDPGLDGLEAGRPVEIRNPNRRPVTVGGVASRLALSLLYARGRHAIPFDALFDDLVAALRARDLEPEATGSEAGLAALRRRLGSRLLRWFFGEIVSFAPRAAPVAPTVTDRPLTGRLQRWQAAHGTHATNLWHEHLPLNDAARALLSALDGSRDRAALAALDLGDEDLGELLARLWRTGFLLDPAAALTSRLR